MKTYTGKLAMEVTARTVGTTVAVSTASSACRTTTLTSGRTAVQHVTVTRLGLRTCSVMRTGSVCVSPALQDSFVISVRIIITTSASTDAGLY